MSHDSGTENSTFVCELLRLFSRLGELLHYPPNVGSYQFEGMVTNINVFFNSQPLTQLLSKICNESEKPDISWAEMVWEHNGNIETFDQGLKLKSVLRVFLALDN